MITDYILQAEKASTALKLAGEEVSDSLLVAMSLKGLPNEYKPFVTIVTQSETAFTFQKYKQSLRNFEVTEKTRADWQSDDNSVMKITHNFKGKPKFVCFKCGV